MTDLATALANTDLGEFEGSEILRVGIEIPGAAGGLRDALDIEPVVMHKDQEILVLIRGTVGKVRFDPVKDTQGVARVHVLNVSDATIVDGDVFESALDDQREKIERAREAAQGVQRLPMDEELTVQHGEGAHAQGLVDGCPVCQSESDAVEAES